MLSTIDELQSSDSANQLAAKRAERELREEKEKALRLERELENLKGRDRWERAGSVSGAGGVAGPPGLNRSGTLLALERLSSREESQSRGRDRGDRGSRRGSPSRFAGDDGKGELELGRKLSTSKVLI